ncbi:MAG: hypothetical protein ABFC85_00115 [Rectinema sp.]
MTTQATAAQQIPAAVAERATYLVGTYEFSELTRMRADGFIPDDLWAAIEARRPAQPPAAPQGQGAGAIHPGAGSAAQAITDTLRARLGMPRVTAAGYPVNGADVMDENIRFKVDTIEAVRNFRAQKSMKAHDDVRFAALRTLLLDLMTVYGMTDWEVRWEPAAASASCSAMTSKVITLRSRSLVDALHEFRHAMQFDNLVRLRFSTTAEWDACRWSLNLFKRVSPRSFAKCHFEGHLLKRNPGTELGQPLVAGTARSIEVTHIGSEGREFIPDNVVTASEQAEQIIAEHADAAAEATDPSDEA